MVGPQEEMGEGLKEPPASQAPTVYSSDEGISLCDLGQMTVPLLA